MKKKVVLLVDDNESYRKKLITILKPIYKVIEAETAKEAINKSRRFHPELLILDMKLRWESTDPSLSVIGLELLKKIKEINPLILKLIITGTLEAIKRLQQEGVEYIDKKDESENILSAINNAFEKKYFWDDQEWAFANYGKLVKEYPNKWVAIVDKKVIATGEGIDEVRNIAKRKTDRTYIPVMFTEGEIRVYKN